jgi:large subunit ribosomal protein L9
MAIPTGAKRRGVELMLAEDVAPLGKQGDVVLVKPGYARNYLVPQGLATVVTAGAKRMIAKHKERQAEILRKKLAEIRKLGDAISKYSVTLEANATPEGHLYGSIVAVDIAKALQKASFAVEPDNVRLDGPIKELGLYTVKMHLHADVECDVKVWVVPTASA